MVNKLLENGRSLNDDTYNRIAKEIGLNMKKFEKDRKNNDAKYEQKIKDDMSLGAKIGVRGTPSFYLNGKTTRSRDFNSFKAEIDSILKK